MIVNYKFNSSGDRFEDRFVIFIGIPVCVLLGILNVFGSMGIIWYEKYGSDLKENIFKQDCGFPELDFYSLVFAGSTLRYIVVHLQTITSSVL